MTTVDSRQALIRIFAMLLLGAVAGLPARGDDAGPSEFIKTTMHALFSAVVEERSAIETNPAVARVLVRDMLTPPLRPGPDLSMGAGKILASSYRYAARADGGRIPHAAGQDICGRHR